MRAAGEPVASYPASSSWLPPNDTSAVAAQPRRPRIAPPAPQRPRAAPPSSTSAASRSATERRHRRSTTSPSPIHPGEFVFLVGAVRLGQVDDDAAADQGDRADRRRRSASPAATSPRSRASRSRTTAATSAWSSRTSSCCRTARCYDNVAYALQVTGGTRTRDPRQGAGHPAPDRPLDRSSTTIPDQLSGGEQQRVSIARAFVNHPPLLLADEPTGNLDPETSIGIMQLLYRINRTGTTVLVATHDVGDGRPMRRRVIELVRAAAIVRDEQAGALRGAASRTARVRRSAMRERSERMRLGFFLREALRALQRNAVPRFAAMATVLVTVLVLGVFIPVVQATTGAANEVRGKVLVDVYLKTDAKRRRHRARPATCSRTRRRTSAASSSSPRSRPTRSRAQAQPQGLRPARLQPAAGHVPRHARQPGQHRQARATRSRRIGARRRAHGDRPRDRRGHATARRTRTRSSPPRAS